MIIELLVGFFLGRISKRDCYQLTDFDKRMIGIYKKELQARNIEEYNYAIRYVMENFQ